MASMAVTYTGVSARTTFRQQEFIIFTVGLPVALYLLFTALYGNEPTSGGGLGANAYLMVSMAAYGAIAATVNAGARVAIERQTGWNRQLRLTSLTGRDYLVGKAASALLVALPAIILVGAAGAVVGDVRMPMDRWILTGLAIWVSMIPFAAMGVAIGSVVKVDAVQAVSMVVFLGMSMLGGLWFPLSEIKSQVVIDIAKCLPSYWVGEIGRDIVAGTSTSLVGVLVLLAWTLGAGAIAAWSYQRSGRKS